MLGEAAGRLDPVELRHPHVHQDDVGQQPQRLVDAGAAVVGLADDLDVLLGVEHRRQAAADQRLVVDHQHLDHRSASSGRQAKTR